MRCLDAFEAYLKRKDASWEGRLNQVNMLFLSSSLVAWTYDGDLAYLDDGPLAVYPAQDGTLSRAEVLLVVIHETEYLLLRVECFGLLVEVVAAVFGVSDPDLKLLGVRRGIHDLLNCTSPGCHVH